MTSCWRLRPLNGREGKGMSHLERARTGPPWQQVLPWLAWLTILALWTVALLTPHPEQATGVALSREASFVVAKSLHLAAYAGLTALLFWLPGPAAWHWLLLATLSLHGAVTEYLQQFIEGRTGSLRDVALDHLGIALGFAVGWACGRHWWRRPARR
jgi:VanZ family protein